MAGEGLTMDDILSVFAMFEWRNEHIRAHLIKVNNWNNRHFYLNNDFKLTCGFCKLQDNIYWEGSCSFAVCTGTSWAVPAPTEERPANTTFCFLHLTFRSIFALAVLFHEVKVQLEYALTLILFL